jgi:uncharacterized protein (TIGR03435 family)
VEKVFSGALRRMVTAVAVGWMIVAVPVLGQDGTAKVGAAQGEAAEASAKIPMYEIVSIRPSKPDAQLYEGTLPDGYRATSLTLENLIGAAYFGNPFSLSSLIEGGPGWYKSDRLDVEAKVDASEVEALKKIDHKQNPEELIPDHATPRMLMLQALLKERFGLKAHYEMKELPVYAIKVAKGGPKLKESNISDPMKGSMSFSNDHFGGTNVPLRLLPLLLMPQVGRPVLDQTGLTGRYDLDLKWTPDEDTGERSADAPPGLMTAIQEQLGLKLEATKGPVKVLVIDHVERPSAN